jgi:hypothetical protein
MADKTTSKAAGNEGQQTTEQKAGGEQKPPAGNTEGQKPEGEGKTGDEAGKTGAAGADGSTQGGGAKDEGKDGAGDTAKKAPDTYELKVPEGGRISPDDVKLVEQIARERGLSNDEAQAVLDDHDEQLELQSGAFLEATKADKEIGGDKLDETLTLAKSALDKIRPKGTPRGDAFRALLNRTGYGNHPEIIAFMAEIGRKMQEDRPGTGSGGGGKAEKSTAEVLYGAESASS